MQLLIQLSRLPFSVAFNILFVHGGFAALERVHGSMEETLYQFWRIYFVSSPVGKLNPERIGQWVEVMCTCHIVQRLSHPAHAIYLLRPVRYEIPESVAAWAVAGGWGNQLRQPEILIHAMRIFIPKGHQPLLQREWFWVSDVHSKRSLREWLEFADEVVENHFFTRHWWTQQKEGPFFMLASEKDVNLTMHQVILKLVQRETLSLKKRLRRDEVALMARMLQKARVKKELKNAGPVTNAMHAKNPTASLVAIGKGKPTQSPTPVKKQPITAFSTANKQEIERLTSLRYTEYTSILSQVKAGMSSMPIITLDKYIKRVMCLVVSLGHQFPYIKWSIKLALHEAAVETGCSNWDIERGLYRAMYSRDDAALSKLATLCVVGKKKRT